LRRERDLLQMDISLGYGLVEYLRILDMLEAHGWSRRQCLPHGGHVLALHAAAALSLGGHETAPLASYSPQLEVEDGFTSPGDAPGAGIEQRSNLHTLFSGLPA
jgi:L-alanine-DL-glutamate epimerase-like enolase superfamily enzyme